MRDKPEFGCVSAGCALCVYVGLVVVSIGLIGGAVYAVVSISTGS